ncbi:transaldolase family protein [Kribbella sp. VKM Ac-2566]|uniref:transaldolase family protein n=1 Tax=Kribbella sp. VKM Ac-2566 TaxID=2512218 RepID=UPI0010D9184C|nr:transaldolase family protein [Kribbella sp. VKM Ac-2566]TDW98545.1 transaldolase [Kribbella sp. VKM Ac-2566]
MTKLEHLYGHFGQSPWLDNLTRTSLRDGTLARMVADGIRGVTANPTIFARSITGSHDYDEQFSEVMAAGKSVDEAYWELVISDASQALTVLRPVFDGGDCIDGLEVSSELPYDASGTITAGRWLRQRMDQPNLLVTIPATGAIRRSRAGRFQAWHRSNQQRPGPPPVSRFTGPADRRTDSHHQLSAAKRGWIRTALGWPRGTARTGWSEWVA